MLGTETITGGKTTKVIVKITRFNHLAAPVLLLLIYENYYIDFF